MFQKGIAYTRQHILAAVGGGLQDCLSHSGGRVVAVCLRQDMNPEAPLVMLVGVGPIKRQYSKILCNEQKNDPVPIFIKRSSNAWEFQGNFKVDRSSAELAVIAEHERASGRNDVQMVIRFIEVSEA